MNPNFMQTMAILFAAFPDRAPTGTPEEKRAIIGMWNSAFKDFSPDEFRAVVTRFVLETPKLFPGDNPIAMIRKMGRPEMVETTGDCIALVNEAVSKFGSYRENEAVAWIEEKSPLIAAAVRRFGFREYCMSDNADVARGQIRAIFDAEKSRAKDLGGIVESASQLSRGKPTTIAGLGSAESIGKLAGQVMKSLPDGQKRRAA